MQSSLAIKVVVKNYKGRVCYECRTELKPRAAPRGRYYCPNCSSPEDKTEGDGEYIITNEYLQGSALSRVRTARDSLLGEPDLRVSGCSQENSHENQAEVRS